MTISESHSRIINAVSAFVPLLQQANAVWVGYSGGLDSTVLAHVLKSYGLPVKLIHVNHQLSVNAERWVAHCQNISVKFELPLVVETVTVDQGGEGVEAAARESRYRAYEQQVRAEEVLCLGHHADDQLETFVYRLMRGAGLKGLGGIPSVRPFVVGDGCAKIIRPLLQVTRSDLLDYANSHQLFWIDDESNMYEKYDRNYIRHHVVPRLRSRWPRCATQVSRTASVLNADQILLEEYAKEDLLACQCKPERLGQSLCIVKLQAYSLARRNHILRQWVLSCGFSLPHRVHLSEIDLMLQVRDDATPEVCWGGCVVARYQGRLFLYKQLPPPDGNHFVWHGDNPLRLPLGQLIVSHTGKGLIPGQYTVQFRQGGERCKPVERSKSQRLKKLLQEYPLEPWLRPYVPLIYSGTQLAAVGGLWICDGFQCDEGWVVDWVVD